MVIYWKYSTACMCYREYNRPYNVDDTSLVLFTFRKLWHFDLLFCYNIVCGLVNINCSDFSSLVLQIVQEVTSTNCLSLDARLASGKSFLLLSGLQMSGMHCHLL